MSFNQKFTRNKGITLIALVVTIIILLMLAGVSVSMLTGQNGILNRAGEAKEKSAVNQNQEELELGLSHLMTEYHIDIAGNGSFSDYIFNNEDKVKKSLRENNVSLDRDAKTITYKDTVYIISDNGKATKIDGIGLDETTKTLTITDEENEQFTLVATLVDITGEITWTSSDPNVATVTGNGNKAVVVSVAQGTTTIKAICNGKEATCEVTVKSTRFADYTWEQIGKLAKKVAENEKYTSSSNSASEEVDGKILTVKVGNTKELTINNKKYTVRVIGLKHDTLENAQTAYGNTNIKKAGISFEFVTTLFSSDFYKEGRQSYTNGGGWAIREVRTILNNGETTAIPNGKIDLYDIERAMGTKEIIKSVKKSYVDQKDNVYTNSSTVETCYDKVWILACSEIWGEISAGSGQYGYTKASEGERYKYYIDSGVTFQQENDKIKKYTTNSTLSTWWWLRSPGFGGNDGFCGVTNGGVCDGFTANGSIEVAPGFAI